MQALREKLAWHISCTKFTIIGDVTFKDKLKTLDIIKITNDTDKDYIALYKLCYGFYWKMTLKTFIYNMFIYK